MLRNCDIFTASALRWEEDDDMFWRYDNCMCDNCMRPYLYTHLWGQSQIAHVSQPASREPVNKVSQRLTTVNQEFA
jgi:hypothetical protein